MPTTFIGQPSSPGIAGGQIALAAAVAPGGEIMVTWEGNGIGDNLGVFERVFARPGNVYRAGFESPGGACVP